MSTKHGSLSPQAMRRLRLSERMLDGSPNCPHDLRTISCPLQLQVRSATSSSDRLVLSKARHAIAQAVAKGDRPLASIRLVPREKKCRDEGFPLIIEDESGFDFFPNIFKTWSLRGETPRCRFHVGTLERQRRHGGFNLLFEPTSLSIRLQKIVLVWDNLRAHKSTENHFRDKHPDWFEFVPLPPYSPELNPVENCWNRIKRSDLANFVSESSEQLSEATSLAAQRIDSDADFLQACFKHAKLKL